MRRRKVNMRRALRILAGLSPLRLSKTFRSPDMESETMSSAPDQTFPTCWSSIFVPSVQVVTALRASTSPRRG
jgi:hypothetical protein